MQITLTTSALSLRYQTSENKPFAADNLEIKGTGLSKAWVPGAANNGILPGTIRSLDEIETISLNCTTNANVTIHHESLHCEWGLVSRDGWVRIKDESNAFLEEDWPSTVLLFYILYTVTLCVGTTPSHDTQDWYFFGHGHNYR